MSGYIGASVGGVANAVDRIKNFTITSPTTVLTSLVYKPGYVNVTRNGVTLYNVTDYTATNGTSITLLEAAQAGDTVQVIARASFQAADTVSASAGGTFSGNVAINGGLSLGDNDKAIFGAGSDLQIYHDSASGQSIIHENGPSVFKIRASGLRLSNATNTTDYLSANDGAEVSIRYNGSTKLATTSTGIDVTGDITPTGGIYLGGTGSDHLLDDYETGTFTPTIQAHSGSNPTVGYSTRIGNYVKIGDLVHAEMNVGISSYSGGIATVMSISGLPFAIGNGDCVGVLNTSDVTFSRTGAYSSPVQKIGSAALGFLTATNGGNWGWEYTNIFEVGSAIRITMTYSV